MARGRRPGDPIFLDAEERRCNASRTTLVSGPEGILASLQSNQGEPPVAFFNAASGPCGLTMMEADHHPKPELLEWQDALRYPQPSKGWAINRSKAVRRAFYQPMNPQEITLKLDDYIIEPGPARANRKLQRRSPSPRRQRPHRCWPPPHRSRPRPRRKYQTRPSHPPAPRRPHPCRVRPRRRQRLQQVRNDRHHRHDRSRRPNVPALQR